MLDTGNGIGQSALMATLYDLWGSTVRSMGFDPTARVLFLIARVTDNGVANAFTLRLFGVSELHIDRPDSESWDCTEIIEAHATETPTGFLVKLVFRNEPNGLSARCTRYMIGS